MTRRELSFISDLSEEQAAEVCGELLLEHSIRNMYNCVTRDGKKFFILECGPEPGDRDCYYVFGEHSCDEPEELMSIGRALDKITKSDE